MTSFSNNEPIDPVVAAEKRQGHKKDEYAPALSRTGPRAMSLRLSKH
jgi:hypothetical protein